MSKVSQAVFTSAFMVVVGVEGGLKLVTKWLQKSGKKKKKTTSF